MLLKLTKIYREVIRDNKYNLDFIVIVNFSS